MTDRIRIGLVGGTPGGSSWGANAHIPAIKNLPYYELKAICTAHYETAQAAVKRFHAEMAFTNVEAMASRPDVDWIVVCVRVPRHADLVTLALDAGKPVLCEWPLGATLEEASRMAEIARQKSLATMVGLQGRSDPTLMYARDLVQQGYVGEVLSANLTVISRAYTDLGPDRFYQHDRGAGANTMTITCGHALDAMCYILGELTALCSRISTRVQRWRNAETGETVDVTSPDTISIAGALADGAEIAVQVATAFNPTGSRLEIHGREGTLVIKGKLLHIGPNRLSGARHGESLKVLSTPDRYVLTPGGLPRGWAANVAQAYVRLANSVRSGEPIDPDFDAAVRLHRLIRAIERSAQEGESLVAPWP